MFGLTVDEITAIVITLSLSLVGISLMSMISCFIDHKDGWGTIWVSVIVLVILLCFIYLSWSQEVYSQKLSIQGVNQMENENVWKYVKDQVPNSCREVLVYCHNGGWGAVGRGFYFSGSNNWLLDSSISGDTVIKWTDLPKEPENRSEGTDIKPIKKNKTIIDNFGEKVEAMKLELTEMEKTIGALKNIQQSQ